MLFNQANAKDSESTHDNSVSNPDADSNSQSTVGSADSDSRASTSVPGSGSDTSLNSKSCDSTDYDKTPSTILAASPSSFTGSTYSLSSTTWSTDEKPEIPLDDLTDTIESYQKRAQKKEEMRDQNTKLNNKKSANKQNWRNNLNTKRTKTDPNRNPWNNDSFNRRRYEQLWKEVSNELRNAENSNPGSNHQSADPKNNKNTQTSYGPYNRRVNPENRNANPYKNRFNQGNQKRNRYGGGGNRRRNANNGNGQNIATNNQNKKNNSQNNHRNGYKKSCK